MTIPAAESSNNNNKQQKLPIVGSESIMSPKKHGTSDTPVQQNLRWNVNKRMANRICNYNRHFAEPAGYFTTTRFMRNKGEDQDETDAPQPIETKRLSWATFFRRQPNSSTQPTKAPTTKENGSTTPRTPLTFYDSNTGKPLFRIMQAGGRSWNEFVRESRHHGWPSFRDDEVIWENVRCLRNGECVSQDGTHLGHNLPDHTGNRYCINLVCISGRPTSGSCNN
eukprot:CAMPEP_0168782486 /NCGR_PEP_ID=MMETSP0725-20121227/9189_1 /TAXON_ID=265536 /ORGANISM="Amphiprora sp., Strain CCMP467" /LENGTH=223 /DNA_ID=CAMNT_0008832421 /DNA_START=162 /DNA_END=830 /DNA_ORIENTATION=-